MLRETCSQDLHCCLLISFPPFDSFLLFLIGGLVLFVWYRIDFLQIDSDDSGQTIQITNRLKYGVWSNHVIYASKSSKLDFITTFVRNGFATSNCTTHQPVCSTLIYTHRRCFFIYITFCLIQRMPYKLMGIFNTNSQFALNLCNCIEMHFTATHNNFRIYWKS